jgi:hypothetical protein
MINFSNWRQNLLESQQTQRQSDLEILLKLSFEIFSKTPMPENEKEYIADVILDNGQLKSPSDIISGIDAGKILGIIEKYKPQAKTNAGYLVIKKRLGSPVIVPNLQIQPFKRKARIFGPVTTSEPEPTKKAMPAEEVSEITIKASEKPSQHTSIIEVIVPKNADLPLSAVAQRFPKVLTKSLEHERTYVFKINSTDPALVEIFMEIIRVLQSAKVNYSKFLDIINQQKLLPTYIPNPSNPFSGLLPVWAENGTGSATIIKLPYLLNKEKVEQAKKELQWLFYNQPEIIDNVEYKKPVISGSGTISVYGNKVQYFNAIQELKKLGFDTKQLEEVYEIKKVSVFSEAKDNPEMYGNIKTAKTNQEKSNAIIQFKKIVFSKIPYLKQLELLKKSDQSKGLKLFPKQWEGVAHLYSRSYAINGDETGVGKTIQFLIASKLRMIDSGKKCLVVTMSDLKSQLLQNIQELFGSEESSKVSFNIENPKEWTIVNYETFQSPKFMIRAGVPDDQKINDFIQQNIAGKYEVMVLDEAHKVKIAKSIRSVVISAIAKYIPVRYNMTATLSANKPIDIKNQLEVVGHQFGKMSDEEFTHNFIEHSALIANTPAFNKKYNLYNKKVIVLDGNKNKIAPQPVAYEEALRLLAASPEGNTLFMFDDSTDPITLMLADRDRFLTNDKFNKAQEMNRLLYTTGVYDKKTKKQINKKLPPLQKKVVHMKINQEKFCQQVRNISRQKILFDKLPIKKNLNLESITGWLGNITMPSTKDVMIKNFLAKKTTTSVNPMASQEYFNSNNQNAKNILSKFGINDADDYGTFFSYIMEKSSAKPLTSAEKQKTNITTIRRLIAMSKVPITINKVKQLLKNNAKQIKDEAKKISVPDDKIQKDTKIVIFTNFKPVAREIIKRIQETLNQFCKENKMPKCGLEVLGYYGDITEKQLETNKYRFKTDPKVRVIVMTMQKGGTGIDFPNIARNMIINDVFYTPESADQAEGRIHRINTLTSPEVYYPVAKNLDIDQKIFNTLRERRKLASIIQRSQEDYIKNNDVSNLEKIKDAEQESKNIENNLEANIVDQIDNICKDVKVFDNYNVGLSFRDFIKFNDI